jgi:hypothetical protein
MLTRPFPFAIVMAGLAAVAPQAARADSMPSLIQHIGNQAVWTVTKASDARKGKVKIFDVEPKYTRLTGNVDTDATPAVAELKEEGDTFTFAPGKLVPGKLADRTPKNYWMVVYPKDTVVELRLDFVKGQSAATNETRSGATNRTSLIVTGFFHNGEWRKSVGLTSLSKKPPEVALAYDVKSDNKMSRFDKDNFGKGLTPKGKPEKVLLTLN